MKTVLIDLTALNTSRRLRGVGRHVRELASALSRLPDPERAGFRFVGLTRIHGGGGLELRDDFVDVDGLPAPQDPSAFDDEKARWLRRIALWRAARRVNADLVHLPDPVATPWLLGGRGPLRIATCHDLSAVRALGPGLLRRLGVAALQKALEGRRFVSADHVIAISSYTAEDLRSLFGLNSSRVSVVYNGVDLRKWTNRQRVGQDSEVLNKFGLRSGRFLLYVGQAAWRKNRTGMLRALRHARETRPHLQLQLAWAGRLGVRETTSIDREARNLGIRHAVRLLNFVSDEELGSLYRSASAHLIVSRHEGFGLTVIEAMACGCPVITTRRTALAEVAGDAAVHVEPDLYEDIGEAVVRVIDDLALRSDLVQRGLARAQLFSSERQARETVAIYRRILDGRASGGS